MTDDLRSSCCIEDGEGPCAPFESMQIERDEARDALATARADALEEAARVADELADKIGGLESYGAHVAAISIRALALTQPASTHPLTDQGETSTAGEG